MLCLDKNFEVKYKKGRKKSISLLRFVSGYSVGGGVEKKFFSSLSLLSKYFSALRSVMGKQIFLITYSTFTPFASHLLFFARLSITLIVLV